MTDPAQARGAGHGDAVPKPTCMRPRLPQAAIPAPRSAGMGSGADPAAGQTAAGRAQSQRTAVRCALEAALTGVSLTRRDRQFLSKLVHWDKRNAASVAALLWVARLTGRDEAALTPRQLDVVLGALADAIAYRTSGADVLGCWDCENIPGGRCADHTRDNERARTYAELASVLSGGLTQADLPRPTEIAGYRSRTPVAS